jgi:hypothetical protein
MFIVHLALVVNMSTQPIVRYALHTYQLEWWLRCKMKGLSIRFVISQLFNLVTIHIAKWLYAQNKLKALKVLRARIYEQERQKTNLSRRDSRNKQIGSGDRSEKIRTYNFPQNRVTDHRINLTLYELDLIMTGQNLPNIIDRLKLHYDTEALLALNDIDS